MTELVIRGTLQIDPAGININVLRKILIQETIKPLSWGYARLAHTAYRRYTYGWGRRAKPRLYLKTTSGRSITTNGKGGGSYGAYAMYKNGSLLFVDFGTYIRYVKMVNNYRRRTQPGGGFAVTNVRRTKRERRTYRRYPAHGGISSRGLTDAIVDETWTEYYEAILRGTYLALERAYIATQSYHVTAEAVA